MSKINPRIKIVSYNLNHGKGYALKEGFSHAIGDYVLFMDSDADISPDQLQDYLNEIKKCDVVIASKRHPQSIVRVPFLRKFLSRTFFNLVQLLIGLDITDSQTGLKIFRRASLVSILKILTISRFAFDVELLAVVKLMKLSIRELPVNISSSRLSFNPIEVLRMFLAILVISYRIRVTKWYHKRLYV